MPVLCARAHPKPGLQLPSLYAFSVITLVINNALFLLSVALLARCALHCSLCCIALP